MLDILLTITLVVLLGCEVVLYLFPWIRQDVKELGFVFRCIAGILSHTRRQWSMIDTFEDSAKAYPKKTFLIFEDSSYTYESANQEMNRVAHVGIQLGLKKKDVVAFMMPSEPQFIWTFYGLSKIGVEPAFLNFNLRNKALVHCFSTSQAKILIVDNEFVEVIESILPDVLATGTKVYICGKSSQNLPRDMHSFDDLLATASTGNIDRKIRAGITLRDPMCYIYTSGTTGLPKAAVVTHEKAVKAPWMIKGVKVYHEDILYTALPLYHTASALVSIGITIKNGATLVLRSKFSASQFFSDCRKHNVTIIQYIGELCRYLCAQPPSPEDKKNSIRVALGNGLRRDIWRTFQERFQIANIVEFYAATEGNIALFNHYGMVGAIGRYSPLLRPLYPYRFLKYDYSTAEPLRDSRGLCIEVGVNEPGLLVSVIKKNFDYDGYKGNNDLSSKKVLRDVLRKGDAYFNTGDLLLWDENYFVYFCDRLGDTFRWKGENVSTIDVANALSDLPFIEDANVYGVKIEDQDGRAGMASITLAEDADLSADNLQKLYHHCTDLLPGYAQPRFLRIQSQMEVNNNFKQMKLDVVRDGFDPSRCHGDQLYYNDFKQRAYLPLDEARYREILNGRIRV